MRKRYYNKIISIVLAISILITSGHIDVYADQVKETFGNIKKTSQEVDNSKKEKVIKKTESSTVYQLEDGMKREVIHDSNIRFKEDGKLVDYDPSLVKVNNNKTHNNADISKYAYENKKGDNKNYIPKKISQETPIILEKENYQITISPINKETNQVKVEDQNILDIYDKEIQIPVKATYEAKDEKSSLEYISQDNGIKENIVLNEAPESNIFEYEMKLDGVKPKKSELEESIVFIDDSTGEAVGSIDAPFMNDASNKAYSEDITYDIKPKEGESDKYILTMTVDNTYLQSSKRQYPVTIDPTVTWSGDSNIIDTYIISGTKYGDMNFYDSGTTAFPVGRGTNGVHRALIKGRKLASTVDGKYVHKATLTMYETSNNDVSNVVRAYRMIKDWNEKTVTWNNRPDYSTSDGYYGTVTTTGTLYKARVMDLTNYARKVANKSITDYGLVLRSSDEGATTGKFSKFFGSRHAGTDIRPKFTVEYYDGPTIASSVKLSSGYLKTGQTFKLDWAGINSKSLNRVEYRIAPYNDADGVVGSDLFKYADSPNLGATSSGSKDITKIKELKEGCYRIYVRGVDSGGIKGTGKGATFHIDSTLPVISSLVASPTSSSTNQIKSQNIALSWKIDEKHLKDVQYNIDGGTFTTVESAGVTNSKFTIPSSKFKTSKTYKIGLKAIDKSGNASAIKYINVYVDAIAPDISKLDLLDSNETSISGNWTKEINPKLNFSNVLETGSGVNLSKVQYALVNEKSSAPASDKYISPKNIKFTSEKNPYEGYLYLDSEVKTGSYDLYIKMLDIAGNTSIKSVNYKKDTEKPNGSIEVKNATESIDVLTDTVYITGAVSDGSGSGIKSSDVKFYKLDASGEIDKNFKPVIVYENATISNTQAFDTRKLNNGQYILKLNMEDNVGYKVEASKKIRVANKIKAPKLTSDLIKDNPCTIKWAYDNNDVLISRIQYKINEEDKWIDVPNSNANSGSFKVNLPEETGEYKVKVRAIDSQGVEGEEGIVICKVDKKAPIVNINSVDKGIIRGTATDENFSEWEIYIKKENEEDSKYEKVLNGKNRVDENILGILDLSSFEIGTYVIKLLGKDTVGNENSFTHRIEKTKDFVNAELIEPKFRVEREYYQNYSSNKIILPPTKKELKLKSDGLNFITRLLGTTTWYIENKNVGTGNTYNDDFYVKSPSNANAKYEENKDYQISVVNKDLFGGVKYSMPLVKNYEIEKVNLSNENITNGAIVKDVKLQEKIASFRLIDSNSSKNLKYEVKIGDGDYKEIKSEDTYDIITLSNQVESDKITIRVTGPSQLDIQDLNDIDLQLDCLEKEYFSISTIEEYRAKNLSATDKINYKTYVKWDIPQGDLPKDIYYEVYRSTESNFKPSEDTLVAKNIQAGYWSEPNVNYSKTYYYKIRAVKVDDSGKVISASSFSDEVSSTVVDSNEYTKRMGIKEYWEYVDIEMPNGTGHIEKSEGNFVYQQTDAVLPNEQLEVTLGRTYNSKSSSKSAFGIGWNHEYDIEILSLFGKDNLEEGKIALKDSTGTIYYFDKQEDGSYISSMGKYINLVKEDKTEDIKIPDKSSTSSGNAEIVKTINSSYTITTKDNDIYRFNSGGQLVYVSDVNDNFLLFEYDNNKGLISKVTTSKNISMEFVYNDAIGQDLLTVKEIILPDKSKIQYKYEKSRLVSVIKVGNNNKNIEYSYEYDDDGNVNVVLDANKNKYEINYDTKDRAEEVVYPHKEVKYPESIKLEYSDNGTKTITKKLVNGNERLREIDEFDTAFGNCLKSTDAEGFSTTYEYTNNLRTKTTYQIDYQTLENGRVVWKNDNKSETTSYDKDENVVGETDEDGTKSEYQYNNARSNEVINDLPTHLKETDGDGKIITDEIYEYDKDGNTTNVYDKITNTTLLTTYTDDGEVESETEILGSPESKNIQSKASYTYSYDKEGNKTEVNKEVADDTTTTTTTVYDVMGRQTSCLEEFVEKSGKTSTKLTTNKYDEFGRLIKTIYKEGNAKETTTEKSYYPNGTVASETAVDKTKTEYTYDEMNREASETVSKEGLTKTWTTTYSYETVQTQTGGGTKTTDYAFVSTEKNPDGYILGQTYQDALGRTIREKENGVYVDLTYDGQGNTVTKYEAGQNAGSEKGILTVLLYDSLGNQTTTMQNPVYDSVGKTFYADGDNTIVTEKKYNTSGNVTEDIDGEGNVTKYEYDAEGRVSKVILPDSENNVTTMTYDVENSDGTTSTIVTDANGNKSETVTNSQDLAVLIKDLGNGNINPITTKSEYNSKDNVIKDLDSEGNYKAYDYDDKERLSAVNYYDSKGNKTLRTEYEYDISDNITVMRDYKQVQDKVTLYRYTGYTYDKLKRLVGYAELDSKDIAGDTPTDVEIAKYKITYEYDIDDNITNIIYPSSTNSNVKGLTFNYNNDKWLQKVNAKVGNREETIREYNYLNDGKVESIKDYRDFAKGSKSTYTLRTFNYDSFGRATSITYTDSGSDEVLEKYEYTYNKNSHITSEYLYNNYTINNKVRNTKNNKITDELRQYAYDDLGRLTQTNITDNVSNDTNTITYKYDKVGNRVKEVNNGKTTNYTYNSLNQLVTSVEVGEGAVPSKSEEIDNSSGSEQLADDEGESDTTLSNKTYTYDKNGNQLREADSITNEVKSYAYDADNRMSKAMFTKAGIVTLNQVNTYNGNGQRVEKSENGQSTKYYYQNDSVLYTTGSANKSTELETPDDTEIMTGVTSLNLMGASENVIATVRDISSSEGEKYYFYNKDMRESTTNVVGVEGKSEVAYEYTDFGETEIKGDENFFNEICYTGGIYDKKTGLYYLNARYYNPEDGRFLTEDTYRGENSDPSSLHLYAYCANNPIAYKDPSGHIPVWGIINAAWGAYDGYNYAKKKNLKGWKKAGAIVGGAVINTVNPFKKLKVGKVARRVSKIAKKRKSTKVVAKRVTRVVKKVTKKAKKVKKSASKTYAKAKCKITKKGCFTAGTLISTEDGLVSIEDIKEGDLVWAQDPETGEIALKPVVQTFIKETDTILYIKTAGETIEATEQHVFFIDGVGWIPASMIEEGDVVALQSGEKAEVEKIDKVVHNELITVYNFEVEDFHTYFVSDTNVLVHNACPTKGKSIKGKTKKTGSRPPNLSPKNAGRRGAFREAKRKNGIPVSQHPKNVRPNLDKRKKKQPGRVYEFKNDIEIRDDSGGHYFPDDPSQNRGSHFNDPDGNHYDYE